MTEAVTLSHLIAIISLVSEIWLATDRQKDRQTDRPDIRTDRQTTWLLLIKENTLFSMF